MYFSNQISLFQRELYRGVTQTRIDAVGTVLADVIFRITKDAWSAVDCTVAMGRAICDCPKRTISKVSIDMKKAAGYVASAAAGIYMAPLFITCGIIQALINPKSIDPNSINKDDSIRKGPCLNSIYRLRSALTSKKEHVIAIPIILMTTTLEAISYPIAAIEDAVRAAFCFISVPFSKEATIRKTLVLVNDSLFNSLLTPPAAALAALQGIADLCSL